MGGQFDTEHGEVIPGSRQSMHGCILTYSRFQRENINLLALGSQQRRTLISASTVPHCMKDGRVKLWIGMTVSSVARPEGKETVSSVAGPEGKETVSSVAGPEGKETVSSVARPEGKETISSVAGPEGKETIGAVAGPEGKETISSVARPEGKETISSVARPEGKETISSVARPEISLAGAGTSKIFVVIIFFVMTNMFVVTKVLVQQAYSCHDKRVCCNKLTFVMLTFVMTKHVLSNACCNKSFVTTSILLS